MFCDKDLKSLESKANRCFFTLNSVSGEHVTPAAIRLEIQRELTESVLLETRISEITNPSMKTRSNDYGQI